MYRHSSNFSNLISAMFRYMETMLALRACLPRSWYATQALRRRRQLDRIELEFVHPPP